MDRCYSGGLGKALIGFNFRHPVITNFYWDRDRGEPSSSYGGVPKTTQEMKQRATFIDWDFDMVWDISEGQSYPFFKQAAPSFVQEIPTLDSIGFTVLGALLLLAGLLMLRWRW